MADIRMPGTTAGELRAPAPLPVSSRDLARYRYSPATERRTDPDALVLRACLVALAALPALLALGGAR